MSEGTHRCCVDGCPNLAAYEAMHYEFDVAEGAVVFGQDGDCPYICVEHAIDSERRAGVAHRELTVYMQLEPAYVA